MSNYNYSKSATNRNSKIVSRFDKTDKLRTETQNRDAGSVKMAVSTDVRNNSTNFFIDLANGDGTLRLNGREARSVFNLLVKHYSQAGKSLSVRLEQCRVGPKNSTRHHFHSKERMEITRSEALEIIKLSVRASDFGLTGFSTPLIERLEDFLSGHESQTINVTSTLDEEKIAEFVKNHKQREKATLSKAYLHQLPAVKCRISSSSFGRSEQKINLGFYCTGTAKNLVIDGDHRPCNFVTIERVGNSLMIFEELCGRLVAHIFDFSNSPYVDSIKLWADAFKENTSYSVTK